MNAFHQFCVSYITADFRMIESYMFIKAKITLLRVVYVIPVIQWRWNGVKNGYVVATYMLI